MEKSAPDKTEKRKVCEDLTLEKSERLEKYAARFQVGRSNPKDR